MNLSFHPLNNHKVIRIILTLLAIIIIIIIIIMIMNMCAAGSLIVGGALVGVKHNFVGSRIGRCPPAPPKPPNLLYWL